MKCVFMGIVPYKFFVYQRHQRKVIASAAKEPLFYAIGLSH